MTSVDVDEFMEALEHPLKSTIQDLRVAILASDIGITEQVKWNAPSFVYAGEDRITFRLKPANRLQLIFHRGARVRSDSATFSFDDHTGLIEWASPDRGVVTFADSDEAASRRDDLVDLVRRWIAI